MLLHHFQKLTIRGKLLAMVLVPLALVLPLLGLLLLFWGNVAFDRLLITKVQSDLAVARGYFDRVLVEVGDSTGAVADSHALHLALAARPAADLVALLREVKTRERLDFINLRSIDGTLLATDTGAVIETGRRAPALRAASNGRASASIEILQPGELALLAPTLGARVTVPLVATRNAAPTTRAAEERAMVVLASAPVRHPDGRVIAYVQAGVLLNRNLPFIDHINEIVYPEGALDCCRHA